MLRTLGEKLKELFRSGQDAPEFFENLEDTLIEADVGPVVSAQLAAELKAELKTGLKEEARAREEKSRERAAALLRRRLGGLVRFEPLELEAGRLNIFLLLGVNGAGKTTTLAKLAHYYKNQTGEKGIVLAAGDTFRAGAIDQLLLHGKRLGLRVVSQAPGADPGAVIFDAIESARSRGEKLLLADTAGRLQNKANLIRELQKIDKIIRGKTEPALYKKILVIDASTGQNGLSQAQVFHEAVGVDSVVLTKFDGTSRGGILIAISRELGLPVSFLGTGEDMTSLIPGGKDAWLDSLLEGL